MTKDEKALLGNGVWNSIILGVLFIIWLVETLIHFEGGWDWFWLPLFVWAAYVTLMDARNLHRFSKGDDG